MVVDGNTYNKINELNFNEMLFDVEITGSKAFNKIKQICKLDTGAGINLITPNLLNGIDYKAGKRELNFYTATREKVKGKEIIIKNIKIERVVFENVEFFVANIKGRNNLLLGIEFIRRVNILIDSSTNDIYFKKLNPDEVTIPLWSQGELTQYEIDIREEIDRGTEEFSSDIFK